MSGTIRLVFPMTWVAVVFGCLMFGVLAEADLIEANQRIERPPAILGF